MNSKVKEAKTLAKVKGVAGVHFDYVRYPGNAFQYKNSIKAVNYFVKKASTAVHKVNKKLIVSAAVMPEPSSMKKYYAQDIPTMSKYVDVIVPMVYKGNYHAGTKWIKSVTKAFAKQSKKAKIWTGLQTYTSDSKLNKLSFICSHHIIQIYGASSVTFGLQGAVDAALGAVPAIDCTTATPP